ncbi:MAG: hypothetical protein WAW86_10125 [Gammaproteobacteria bacterium]
MAFRTSTNAELTSHLRSMAIDALPFYREELIKWQSLLDKLLAAQVRSEVSHV